VRCLLVVDADAFGCCLLEGSDDSCRIRRVGDDVDGVVVPLVDDEIVDHSTLSVTQQRILRLACIDAIEIVREHRIDESGGTWSVDGHLSHVRDIE
jgi:hypothetical protein